MSTVWLVVNFFIYTFVLLALYRQSYNLLLIIGRRPLTWILFIGFLAVSNVILAYVLSWDPMLVSAVFITVVILNISPSSPPDFTKDEIHSMVDEVYKELEISHGRSKSRIGLVIFGLCSIGAYILFFGEVCNQRKVCTSIFKTIF